MPPRFYALVLVNVANAGHSWWRYSHNERTLTLIVSIFCTAATALIYWYGLQSQRYAERAKDLQTEIAKSEAEYRVRMERLWSGNL
jgi:hypothetical protein